MTGADVKDFSIGTRDLKGDVQGIYDSELVPAGGDGSAQATCPAGTIALFGGGFWQYTSGTLSDVRHIPSGAIVSGRNRGTAPQRLNAFARCLPE